MTGRFLPEPAGAVTSTVKQSSLCGTLDGISGASGCVQAGPGLVASHVPVQGCTGCGDTQRFSFTGTAAYGIPTAEAVLLLAGTEGLQTRVRLGQLSAERAVALVDLQLDRVFLSESRAAAGLGRCEEGSATTEPGRPR